MERTATNGRHTVRDGDRGEVPAARERIIFDGRNAVGDVDRGKAGVIERTLSDSRYTVADGDGGEVGASLVFANHFISTSYNLNGRKVMT